MFKIGNIMVLLVLMTGCATEVVPKTTAQMQVVSYAELTAITNDVYEACQIRVLSKDTCTDLFEKIKAAKTIIDAGLGLETAADILIKIKEKL